MRTITERMANKLNELSKKVECGGFNSLTDDERKDFEYLYNLMLGCGN